VSHGAPHFDGDRHVEVDVGVERVDEPSGTLSGRERMRADDFRLRPDVDRPAIERDATEGAAGDHILLTEDGLLLLGDFEPRRAGEALRAGGAGRTLDEVGGALRTRVTAQPPRAVGPDDAHTSLMTGNAGGPPRPR